MIRSPIYPRTKAILLGCIKCDFKAYIWSPTLTGVLKCPHCKTVTAYLEPVQKP